MRTCYNCGNVSHFVVDCPYEQREDNGGKLIRKDKTKSFPNRNNFPKKMPPKGLVAQEEYLSDEDDDDETSDETMGMATMAIASSSPSKVSLFKDPNENRMAKCLMAKASDKVTSNAQTSNIKATIFATMDSEDKREEVEEENSYGKFMKNLKGKPKKHVVSLLEQLGEANDIIESHEDTISTLQGHSRDYDDEITDLSIALEKEQGLRLILKESFNDDLAKLKKDLDHALVLTSVLQSEKSALGLDHVRLKKELATLDKAHKALKSTHVSLKESHAQLQVKLTKEIATCSPVVLIDNVHAANPCCEHAHLVEENSKLREQLEKGLVTCIQGEKNLNDLLTSQKEVVAKEGVGFAPKTKKKTKQPPQLMETFVKSRKHTHRKKKNQAKGGNAMKGNTPLPNTADDFNPSYVLCRANDGNVFAKFAGSYDEYIAWSIWVPKTLVTDMRGPIKEWIPKSKH